MTRSPVTVHRGYYTIDQDRWVEQRVGAADTAYTQALHGFLASGVFAEYQPRMDFAARMLLWCEARGWHVHDGGELHHDDPVLDRPVTVVLADDPDGQPWALVRVGTDRPTVYADVTTDDGYWNRATVVDIVCPADPTHRWTWLDGDEFAGYGGEYGRMRELFGDRPPIGRCRGCAAYDDGDSDQMCWCDNSNVVYCPAEDCGQRCTLTLPDVPTHPATRRWPPMSGVNPDVYLTASDNGDDLTCPDCGQPITRLDGGDKLGSLLAEVTAHRCPTGPASAATTAN